MDESSSIFSHPLAPFAFSLERNLTTKNVETTLMNRCHIFSDNAFLESNKNERRKGISESMLHFNNHTFFDFNEKVQRSPKSVSKNQYHVSQTMWLFLKITRLAHRV